VTTTPVERDETDPGVETEGPMTDRPEPVHPEEAPEETSEESLDAEEHTAQGRQIDPETTVNLTGDIDATVNLTGADLPMRERDDAAVASEVARGHLKGLVEALVFASDKPIKGGEIAKASSAPLKQVKEILEELKADFATRGVQLDEVAGGWIFRTNAAYAPFVRDLTKQKPVKLTRAQIETLSILAYRQPMTRPEIDDIRGVDCGPVLKLLLERDLVRMLGRKDEPGRPVIYGTTTAFLEFFGLKSLKDLPTLREFTDLNEESRRTVERELGETLESTAQEAGALVDLTGPSDTLPPDEEGHDVMNTEIPPPMAEPVTSDDVNEAAVESATEAAAEGKPEAAGELDPEDEFPDDDDSDFDDDDEDEDEDEEDEAEEKDGDE
jgi:segregation and condensation protein B